MTTTFRPLATGGFDGIAVAGVVEAAAAKQFRDELVRVIDNGTSDVVLDIQDAVFLDSSGFGVIVGAMTRLHGRGRKFGLVCTDEHLVKLFSITGLDKTIALYPSIHDAAAGHLATRRDCAAAMDRALAS